MGSPEKLVIMVTHGPDDPELATLPFTMAAAALASDVDVVMGFQGEGCLLLKKGVAETVSVPNLTPISGLIGTIAELGGKLLVCWPGLQSRGLDQDDLVEGAEIVAAARLIVEVTAATNTLTY
jgi:predicted peroxiredoxin